MKVVALHVRDHLLEVRKSFLVYRERSIILLIVDVQIDYVGRNFIRSQTRRNFADSCLGLVTVARLLKTQRPQRRKRRQSGEPGVSAHHLFWIRSVKNVIVDRATLRAKRVQPTLHPSKIET